MTQERTIDRALGIMRGLAKEDACVVSHPDAGGPCTEPAIGTVWNLSFCRAHFAEAEAAACEEILEDAERAVELLAEMENGGHLTNPVLAGFLDRGSIAKMRSNHGSVHKEALREAYPITWAGTIDPDTLAYDYESERAEAGPVDWWWEMHWLLCKFMRQALERGAIELIKMLEPLRERACAQVVLAEEDYERRWAAPRRAKHAGEAAVVVEHDGG